MLRPLAILGPAVVVFGLLIDAIACSSAKTESRSDPPPPSVAAAAVKRESLARELVLSAEFRPYQEIEVHAKVAGYLKKIYVDVGDRVQAGQPLAVLEIPEMTNDLVQATASKRRSESELIRARDELERAQSAHAATHNAYTRLAAVIKVRPNLVAQQEIDDALAKDRVTEGTVAAAKSAIVSAEQQVQVSLASEERVKTMANYSRITAPFAGVITKRYADTGAMIQAGTASQSQAMPVVRLSQNDRLRLVLPIPESAVAGIRVGFPVEVRVGALNRTFVGKVARFSGRVQSSTRTMETEVDVQNPKLELIPGMYADAAITLERHDHTLSVPIQAVSGAGTNPTVLLIRDQKRLEERPVKLGIETPNKFEIVSGLEAGDLIVVGGRNQFKTGQLVTPKLMDVPSSKGER